MSQISRYPISKDIADRIFEIFLKTLTKIKSKEDADQFISNLLTPTEKVMLAKRLAIAFLLERNYNYRAIQQVIKVSTGTISSVNTALQHGNKGYKKIIEKITSEEMLTKTLEDAVIKILSMPAALERGKGSWSYLKQQTEQERRKNEKPF